MNRALHPLPPLDIAAMPAAATGEYLDLRALWRAARRQAPLVAVLVVLGGVLALAYALSMPPKFTSFGTVLIDEDRAELIDAISEVPSAMLRDSTMQSEVEVMKSEDLALRIVDRLGLAQRADALAVEPSPASAAVAAAKGTVRGLFGTVAPAGGAGAPPADPRVRLARTLRENLTVMRVGRSTVLTFSYTAPSPELAQEIAGAYADTYVEVGRGSRAAATETAISWLRGRTDELRAAAVEAARELETFRSENGLVSVGQRLLSEQQLSELMSQVILAEGEASRANALAAQADAAIAAGPEAALANLATAEGGRDAASERLRETYLDNIRQRRRVVDRFGEQHPEAMRLAREGGDLERMIFEEVQRRATQARNTAAAQASRVATLRDGLAEALSQSTGDRDARYRLSALEQTAQSYADLYQAALTRLERTVQQASLPISEARVLTGADLPTGASSPSKAIALAVGLVLGGLVGCGIGLVRELTRKRLADAEDVERTLGLKLAARLGRVPARERLERGGPSGAFAASLLRVKLAVDRLAPGSATRTIAFAGHNGGEGTTMLAANFAALLGRHDIPVLLVDAGGGAADLLPPDRVGQLLPTPEAPAGGAMMAVRIGAGDGALAALLAGSDGLQDGLARLSRGMRYVVIDLPPVRGRIEAEAFASLADALVLVSRRRRRGGADLAALRASPDIADRPATVVLNAG